MSTTPVVSIVTQLHPISAFLKNHERLFLLTLGGLVLWFAIGKIDTLIANHDNANLQQAKVVALAQADKTQALAAQSAQQAAQYQALAAKLDAQNAALVQANVQATLALAQRQKTDAGLPTPELANRWTVLVPQAKPVATPNGVTLDSAGALATVQQLEQLPVLKQAIVDYQQQVMNGLSLITAEGQQVATLNTEVGSLRLQLGDNAKVCAAQVATVKAEARKSKRRWFYIGFAAGFVSRQMIKTYTGL
jgi:hypothetical protein